jgi:hypothetical protein
MAAADQTAAKVKSARCILALIVSFATLPAQEPPRGLAKLVAARETASENERNQYAYRQTMEFQEMDNRGTVAGRYREEREVVFLSSGERVERAAGKPLVALVRMKLTDEDFRDIRDVQSLLLTEDQLFHYETKFKGEERVDEVDCWVLQVRPRQILDGQRLFDGLLWIDKSDYSIVRSEGKAVPDLVLHGQENLFPRFVTYRQKMPNGFRFPVRTVAADTLAFKTGLQRVRMTIEYRDYKRFGAESSVTFK